METETDIPDEPRDKINRIKERLEDTREEMEIEALIFVEATKQFTFEWIKKHVDRIFGINGYDIEYNDMAEGAKRGIIYITTKPKTDE